MFETIDPTLHATKRKRASSVYSKSYIQKSEDIQAILTETLFKRFLVSFAQAIDSAESIDAMKPLQAVILDVASACSWGMQNGTRYLVDDAGRAGWQEMYSTSRPPSTLIIPIELPRFTKFLSKFGLSPLPKDSFYYNDMTGAWCLD